MPGPGRTSNIQQGISNRTTFFEPLEIEHSLLDVGCCSAPEKSRAETPRGEPDRLKPVQHAGRLSSGIHAVARSCRERARAVGAPLAETSGEQEVLTSCLHALPAFMFSGSTDRTSQESRKDRNTGICPDPEEHPTFSKEVPTEQRFLKRWKLSVPCWMLAVGSLREPGRTRRSRPTGGGVRRAALQSRQNRLPVPATLESRPPVRTTFRMWVDLGMGYSDLVGSTKWTRVVGGKDSGHFVGH